MLKYPIYIFILLLSLSCKNQEETLFEMPYRVDYEIAAGLNTFETHYINFTNVRTNAADLLAASGYTAEEISTISAKSARITSFIPTDELEFLREVSVRIYENDPFQGREIFYRDNIPNSTRDFVDLIPALPNVVDDMLEENINLSIRMEFFTPPPRFIEVKLEFDFLVQ